MRPVPTGTDFLPWARRRHRRTLLTFAGSLVFALLCLVVIIVNWGDLQDGSVTLALAIPLLAGSLATAWVSRSWLRIGRQLVQTAEPVPRPTDRTDRKGVGTGTPHQVSTKPGQAPNA